MAHVPALATGAVRRRASTSWMAIYDPLISRWPSSRVRFAGSKLAAASSALAMSISKHARRESAWAVRKAHSSDEVLGREDRDCGDSDWSWRSPRLQSLGLLLLACVANQACRALPFYLVDFGDGKAGQAMNQDLDFNSADYGFFATLCFSVPFTLTSLWAGVMADRMDRFQLTAFAGVAWSLSTAGMAVASSYGGLLLLRVALGLSQAATNPAALSLIAELFPDARATANSIFGLGIYLGGALASLGAFVDEQEGWRAACLVFGFFSVAASLPALTKRDEKQAPVRRSTWPADDMDLQTRLASLPEAAATVWESSTEAVAPTGARWLLLASALRFSAGFAILVWLPSSVRATFPNDVEQFAIVNSLIKGFAGSISSISGGLAADALRSRGFGDRSAAWFCAASSILSAPLWYFTLADGFSFEVCMGFLCAEYLVAESWLGAAISALQGAVPADRRGTAQGVFSSLTALGQALPVGLGLLAPEDLTQGLQLSVSVCYCLSGLCFLIASSHLSQEVPQDER
ncbi:MFS-type efflux pump MSMEG_3705 [Durusdinium trenchii]|uniref:MFS-type efflux pump MSMEG_3705 n=1 Tax=Durusdinium trenchii TaxID=1381693 RepID=A0ABP0Q1I3_9DINO